MPVSHWHKDHARRLWQRTQVRGPDDCWLWTGQIVDGYGVLKRDGKRVGAHRVSWELVNGPKPDGLVLDHLCRVRHCVNPRHLRVVTNAENVLCGEGITARNARKTKCPQGHDYSYVKSTGWRRCRTCANKRDAARRAAARVPMTVEPPARPSTQEDPR